MCDAKYDSDQSEYDELDQIEQDKLTRWDERNRLAAEQSEQGLSRPLPADTLAWAVRRENTNLLALLDATLAHSKREGLILPIVDRWIPVRVTVR